MAALSYPTPLPYLPNSIYLEVFAYLSGDKSAIQACTQVSKLFCGLSSVHLMNRVTCVVADALVASLYDASLRGRLFYTKELVLVRREPKAMEGSSEHAASKGKRKGKKTQTKSTSGSNSVSDIAYEDPNIFIPPPEGHLNVFMLHSLLRNMPHIESLTIRRLHVVPGPPFYIQPFPNIHALHFEGVDTGNAFHSLLPLWDHIDTLTISEHWNGMVIPDGPVHLPDMFPYSAEEGSGVTGKLRIGALKTTTVMPKVLHYWTKALRVFLDPEGTAIGSLGLHESLFLFETDIAATDSAILEVVDFVREVDLDMSSNQSLYLTRGILLPPLSLAHSLTTITIRCWANKNSLRAIKKLVLSAYDFMTNTPPQSLSRINLHFLYKHKNTYFGDPEPIENCVAWFTHLDWPALKKMANTLGWLTPITGQKTIHVAVYDKPEDKGGKLWMQDELRHIFRLFMPGLWILD